MARNVSGLSRNGPRSRIITNLQLSTMVWVSSPETTMLWVTLRQPERKSSSTKLTVVKTSVNVIVNGRRLSLLKVRNGRFYTRDA